MAHSYGAAPTALMTGGGGAVLAGADLLGGRAGSGRQTTLYGCYARFGLSFLASLNVIAMIWARLTRYGGSGTARVPTLWIVLGPSGQFAKAARRLCIVAALAVDHRRRRRCVLHGVAVWGFTVL